MGARTVSVKLTAEVGNYITGMRNAAAASRDLATSTMTTAQRNKDAFQKVGTGMLALGAAAGVGVGAAVAKFADFDQAMSNVQAATHATAGTMSELRDAALEAGARTAFSATEAAEGIEALSKAGVSTAAILNGGLNGALDLAAAGSLGVGDAAEIAATALTQFGLKGAAVPHVADLLAAAAGKAQGEVSDMGMALKQSGLVAAQTGLSIEETTTALAAFASAGLLGSDAGTSLKTMLQRLTPESDKARSLMAELGIEAYDAQGNFVGLEEYAGKLRTGLAGLTDEQRNAALATVFGSDAVRAASVLYEQGAAGIADWTAKVDDAGYAQETAALKLNNLKGDLEAFAGSAETAFIKSGSAANGALREIVQFGTGTVNVYSDLPGPAQTATTALVGVVGAAGAAGGAVLLLTPRIAETREALSTLRSETPRTAAAMTNLGKAAGIAGVVLTAAAAWSQLVEAMGRSRLEAAPAVGALTNSLAAFLRTGETTGELANVVGDDFDRLAVVLRRAGESGSYFTQGFWQGNKVKDAQQDIAGLDNALAGLVAAGHADQAAEFFDRMSAAAAAQGVSVDVLTARLPHYSDAVEAATAETALAGDAQQGLQAGLDGTTEAAEQAAEAMQKLADLDAGFINPAAAFEAARSELEAASRSEAEKSAEAFNDSVDAKIKAAQREYDARLAVARDTKGISDAAIQKIEDERDATVDALGEQKRSWEDYADGVKVSVAKYLEQLQKQVDAQTGWERNMLLLSGRVSAGVLAELQDMGEDGAPLVAELVHASDTELAKLEGLMAQRAAEATAGFADTLLRSGPVLAAIAKTNGQKTADALAGQLAAGKTTLEAVMAKYGLAIEAGVAKPIQRSEESTVRLIRKLTELDGMHATVTIEQQVVNEAHRDGKAGGVTRADGGWVFGPGGPRDDRVNLWASPGEYVVNARAAAANSDLLEALNRGSRFADGGWITGRPAAPSWRGDDLVIPGAVGEFPLARVRDVSYDEFVVTITGDVDSAGNSASDTAAQFVTNLRALQQLLIPADGGTIEVTKTLTIVGGTTVLGPATARCVSTLAPRMETPSFGRVLVRLKVYEGWA